MGCVSAGSESCQQEPAPEGFDELDPADVAPALLTGVSVDVLPPVLPGPAVLPPLATLLLPALPALPGLCPVRLSGLELPVSGETAPPQATRTSEAAATLYTR
jgi:hypothetical protein